MGDLEAERQRLKEELKDTKHKIRKAKQKAKARDKAADREWQLTPWQKSVAVTIYLLAAYQAEPVVPFLRATAKKRRWAAKGDDEMERLAEDLFVGSDVDQLAAMADLESPQDPAVAKEALKYVEEWRILAHARDMNHRLGIAPSTDHILQQLEANRLQIPEPLRPPSRGTVAEAKAKMWARRWRLRSGARHGKLRVSDDVPLAEMQQKATRF